MKRSVAIVGALGMLAAGCTGDGPPVPAVEAISDATAQAGSARMTMEMTTSLGDAGSTSVVMEGVTTFGASMEEIESELAGRVEIPGAAGGDLEGAMRMVDGRLFVSGFFAQSLGSTATGWVEIAGEQRDAFAQLGGGAADPTDPTALLSSLEAATDLRAVGSETVRGEPTRHLHAEVTYLELTEAQGIDIREQLETQQQATGQPVPEDTVAAMIDAMGEMSADLDLWVDDEDRVRRTRMRTDLTPLLVASAGAGGVPPAFDEATMTMTFEMYDYGVPVDVEVPEDVEQHTPAAGLGTGTVAPGMAAQSGDATFEVEDGPWAGRYEGEGTCRTTDLGDGAELDVQLRGASADRNASVNLRAPFEDGVQDAISFTLWGDDGQHQSGTATIHLSIGPRTERGGREFVDVDFDGTIEGWGVDGSVSCRPSETG